MPTFGRLSKHSNRSQNNSIPEDSPLNAVGTQTRDASEPNTGSSLLDSVAAGAGSSGIGRLADLEQDMQTIDAYQHQQLPRPIQQQQASPIAQNTGLDHFQRVSPSQHSQPQPQPPSPLAPYELQQQQQPSSAGHPPPPPLYSASSTGSTTNNNPNPGTCDFGFDARQQQHHPALADAPVHRTQSLRYPSHSSQYYQIQQPHPQQHQDHYPIYGTAPSSSLDDLPSPTSYNQQQHQQPPQQLPAPPPEKQRSSRKLHMIKGFFGSVRGTSDTSSSIQATSPNTIAPAPAPVPASVSIQHPANQHYNTIATAFARQSSNKRNSRIQPFANIITNPTTGDEFEKTSYDEANYRPSPYQPHPQQNSQLSPGQIGSPQQDQQLQLDNSETGLDIAPQLNQPQQLHRPTPSQQLSTEGRLLAGYPSLESSETASQLSHESSVFVQESRNQTLQALQFGSTQHVNQQPGMAPPGQNSRRGNEAEQAFAGRSPSFRLSNSGHNPTGSMSLQGTGGVNVPFRGERGHFESADQGRETPVVDKDTESEKNFKELLTKYKNVKRLYFDGKSRIEQLNGQVEQLQNAVANQRMSQSRTALDDNEYATRFNRLNGAINNLSFNIRKDWRTTPQWLANNVSPDALKTGKQEMTAIGRAVISRWLVTELFDQCFHPDLNPQLSAQLKNIEMGIRGNTHTMLRQEEFDAQTIKIVNWRMATLDGLKPSLGGQASAENRAALIERATTDLAQHLHQHLNDPPPPGIEGSTSMIVELAIGVAANLPLESRDVSIWYPMPGEIVRPNLMEVEKTGLPNLAGVAESDSDEDEGEDSESGGNGGNGQGKGRMGDMSEPKRVRFAGFVALEVKGRQVLMKAPVWTL